MLDTSNMQVPVNKKAWGDEIYAQLEKALIKFSEDYPNPGLGEQIELIGYASELAAELRGVTDEAVIEEADEYAVDNVLNDLDNLEEGEHLQPLVAFALTYLDVHFNWGLIEEEQLEDIMNHFVANFDLTLEL